MGFRIETATEIVLDFSDPDLELQALEGATVRCRSMPMRLAEAIDEIDSDPRHAFLMDKVVIDWDFEDEHGRAIPATVEGLRSMPPWVEVAIRRSWIRGLLTPPSPLGERSRNGSKLVVPPEATGPA